MNKHKYLVYTGAGTLLIASFLCWTLALRWHLRSVTAHVLSDSVQYVLERDAGSDLLEAPAQAEYVVQNLVPQEDMSDSHAAAPSEPSPVVPEEQPIPVNNESSDMGTDADDLSSWEISQAWGISIPTLGIRAPVLLPSMKYWSARSWGMLEQQMQAGLSHGTVAYPHSVAPGEPGALIIAGHSSPPDERTKTSPFGAIFSKVPNISAGEDILVSRSGKQIRYRVESTEIVSPESTDILVQNTEDGGLLRLITCYPVGTTKSRFIVNARLVGEGQE